MKYRSGSETGICANIYGNQRNLNLWLVPDVEDALKPA
jgi:hypothetical protein